MTHLVQGISARFELMFPPSLLNTDAMLESVLCPSDSFALHVGIQEGNDLAILHDRREQVLADFKDEGGGGEAEAR